MFTIHLHRIAFVLSVTLILCKSCCFMNNEKENKRIQYIVNLTNKGNKTLSFFLSFFRYQTFNKKLITTREQVVMYLYMVPSEIKNVNSLQKCKTEILFIQIRKTVLVIFVGEAYRLVDLLIWFYFMIYLW